MIDWMMLQAPCNGFGRRRAAEMSDFSDQMTGSIARLTAIAGKVNRN